VLVSFLASCIGRHISLRRRFLSLGSRPKGLCNRGGRLANENKVPVWKIRDYFGKAKENVDAIEANIVHTKGSLYQPSASFSSIIYLCQSSASKYLILRLPSSILGGVEDVY
jgi:hypothetical protein